MNRSTFILGFTLLVVAATLAATITVRNAPMAAREEAAGPRAAGRAAIARRAADPGVAADGPADRLGRARGADGLHVSLPQGWLESCPVEERAAWQARVAAVEAEARRQLDQLTTELDLTAAQRGKLFPTLASKVPGYDPAMLVGGWRVAADPARTADEEIHDTLDPDQQAQLEDEEVKRQLWWQDVLDRLESDLLDSTGGAPAGAGDQPADDVPAPPADERVAPGPRDGGSLFDLLDGTR